jgi:quercetin dioxygenase-like cupin family protein
MGFHVVAAGGSRRSKATLRTRWRKLALAHNRSPQTGERLANAWEDHMRFTSKTSLRTALIIAALAMSYATACAIDLNPNAIAIKTNDQIKWRDPTGAAPVNQAILHGDPTKPGLYIVMNKFKPGAFSKPHFHPNDRFITVISGRWWVGTGSKWDKNATVPVRAGGVVTHFAKQVHYDGAKDEEVVLMIVGEGSGTLTFVEESK